MRRIIGIALGVGVSALLATACAQREEAPRVEQLALRALPPAVTPAMAAEGRQVFLDDGNCFACHGQNARGTVFGPNLADGQWLHISGEYDDIARVVEHGIPHAGEYPSPMPPMGGGHLSEAEVKAVAAYVYAINHRRSDLR